MERWNKVSQNDKSVFGKPDFVLRGSKIAIFCDGEFGMVEIGILERMTIKAIVSFGTLKSSEI